LIFHFICLSLSVILCWCPYFPSHHLPLQLLTPPPVHRDALQPLFLCCCCCCFAYFTWCWIDAFCYFFSLLVKHLQLLTIAHYRIGVCTQSALTGVNTLTALQVWHHSPIIIQGSSNGKWRCSNIKHWGKQLTKKKVKDRSDMGAHCHTEANCSDLGFKWFAMHLSWDWQPIIFLNFKASYMSCFLYAWFAHIVWILEVIEEEQEKILRHHETHGRFSLLWKNNTDETRILVQHIKHWYNASNTGTTHQTLVQRIKHWYNASTTISLGHRHKGELNNYGKMKIYKRHQTFEEIR